MQEMMLEQEMRTRRGHALAAGKWNDYCKSISDSLIRSNTALLLENQAGHQNYLNEVTTVRNPGIANMQKFSFPLIRAIYPNLITQDLVSVQPMQSSASEIFYMSFVYGTSKGAILAGQSLEENVDHTYSQDHTQLESVNSNTGPVQFFLSFTPVRPNTLTLTDGTLTITDDGAGGLVGNTGGPSTINYATGAIDVTWSQQPGTVTAEYSYEMEGTALEAGNNIPQIDLALASSPVIARPRKLRARWSMEAAYNLRNQWGIDAEAEMLATMAEEIKFEIDREVIADLVRVANAGPAVSFDASFNPASAGYPRRDHYDDFVHTLIDGSQQVFSATRRAQANWLVCGVGVATIVEGMSRFVPEPAPAGTLGAQRIGRLAGRWDVYKDPYMTSSQFLLGYKGGSALETGYVYAPYIPLYMTDTIALDDFLVRKGVGTSYGKKVVNNKFYQLGNVANAPI